MLNPRQTIIVLGPTAGGKSEFAVALAEALAARGERRPHIIGADSMQVYRHMHAGTAKPDAALRARAAHHLIDIIEPTQRFTVADWLEKAERLIGELAADDTRAIVVGGTNLYIKALVEGLFPGPPIDRAFRDALADVPGPALHARLRAVDPASADRIHPNDHKKLVRALEVHHLTGQPISAWQTQWGAEGAEGTERPSDQATKRADADRLAATRSGALPGAGVMLGLHWPVEAINPRINLRVKAMFHPEKVDAALAAAVCPTGESLPAETARLEAAGMLGEQARQALGYKQVLEHLAGTCSLDEAFERTKILTRRFAKTQRTWLKRFTQARWLDAPQRSAEALATDALNVLDSEA